VSAPLSLVLAFLGLVVAAKTRLNAVVMGQPVSVPVLWLIAAIVVLLLAALVLVLLRLLLADGLRIRPRMANP
jgi:phosphate/sulfate permease